MKISTLLSAALAAATLASVAASTASAAPTPDGGEYVSRAVRSPNGKDMFVRVVKVPRMQAAAMRDCPMMDPAHCAQPKATKPQAQG
jgi:Spy/CpxP family protein refolding chaperone